MFVISDVCGQQADIMFLVDVSGSIQETDVRDWDRVKTFLKDSIRGLARLSSDARFSITIFSHDSYVYFKLDRYRTLDEVLNAVDDTPYVGATTDMTSGFEAVRNEVIPGARSGVPKILILMTDGKPNEQVNGNLVNGFTAYPV